MEEKQKSNAEEQVLVFKTDISFILSDDISNDKDGVEAELQLFEDKLCVLPKFKQPLTLSFRDIVNFESKDYKVYFYLNSKEVLQIFDLGYKYEDFLRIFSRLYNEMVIKDLLMNESIKKSGVDAEFIIYDENNIEKQNGNCELRIYDTAILILPEKGELKRIIFSDIEDIKDDDYKLIIKTESGEKIILSKLGNKFDSFTKEISSAINDLSIKVQNSLKELMPDVNSSTIRKIAEIMKEGKAAKRENLEKISKDLWQKLEKKILSSEIKEEYEFLKSISRENKISIGLKRDLLGDLTGEYIWFLIPIYSEDKNKPQNAVAMEAITGEEGAKATYFFRMLGREEYKKIKKIDEMDEIFEKFLIKINRAMLAINFRREPIYLPDEKLNEPQYMKYKYAIAKIPALKDLRNLFIGRVIHSSTEQWKNDVTDLLQFNKTAKEDTLRWKK